MGQNKRSVRFIDFLPAMDCTDNDEAGSSPVPMISPSLKEAKIKVVHSIFSPSSNQLTPSYQANGNFSNSENYNKPDSQIRDNYMARQLQFLTAAHHPAVSLPPRGATPRPALKQKYPEKDEDQKTTPSTEKSTPRSKYGNESFFCHLPVSTIQKDRKNNNFAYKWKSPSGIFFSPAISPAFSSLTSETLKDSRYCNTSNLRIDNTLISKMTTTTNEISIQMLSLDNIQRCESLGQIQLIIEALEEQNDYPSLLRVARRRLKELNNALKHHNVVDRVVSFSEEAKKCFESNSERNSSKMKNTDDSRGSLLKVEEVNTFCHSSFEERTNNESSLIMSLSTDDEYDYDFNNAAVNNSRNNCQEPRSIDMSNLTLKSPFTKDPKHEHHLDDKIQLLTQTITELENLRVRDQKEFAKKIKILNDAKKSAELKIRTLEAAVSSDKLIRQPTDDYLIHALAHLHEEKHTLERRLSEEQMQRIEEQRESLKLESRLEQEIADLQNQLARASSENTKQSQKWERKHQELTLLLRSAQGKLEDTKKERDLIILKLLQITTDGQKIELEDVCKMSKQEREESLANVETLFKRNCHAVETLRKTLNTCESSRDAKHMALQEAEKTCADGNSEHNYRTQIRGMHFESVQNRQQQDSLTNNLQKQHMNQLEQRKNHIISLLQEKLHQSNTRTSGSSHTHKASYRPLTSESKHLANRNKLKDLEEQTSKLEERLLCQGIKPAPCRSFKQSIEPISQAEDLENNMNKRRPENSLVSVRTLNVEANCNEDKENALAAINGSVSLGKHAFSSQRREMVRAAGGRKGLADKLKNIRNT